MKKMNQEIKKRWVAALRSGAYTQTKFATARRYRGKYRLDVLGVLCMLHKEDQIKPDANFTRPKKGRNGALEYDSAPDLSSSVRKWAGLQRHSLKVKTTLNGFTASFRLTSLNDEGVSFKALAGLIEAQL